MSCLLRFLVGSRRGAVGVIGIQTGFLLITRFDARLKMRRNVSENESKPVIADSPMCFPSEAALTTKAVAGPLLLPLPQFSPSSCE